MTNNTKINHIIASSRDHYNSNFIDRVAYKYKYKYEPIFSSYAQSYFFSLKMWKIASPTTTRWNIQNIANP